MPDAVHGSHLGELNERLVSVLLSTSRRKSYYGSREASVAKDEPGRGSERSRGPGGSATVLAVGGCPCGSGDRWGLRRPTPSRTGAARDHPGCLILIVAVHPSPLPAMAHLLCLAHMKGVPISGATPRERAACDSLDCERRSLQT